MMCHEYNISILSSYLNLRFSFWTKRNEYGTFKQLFDVLAFVGKNRNFLLYDEVKNIS